MEDEKILIDRKTLKAISSDTRMDLLKHLSNRRYTLSELSKKMDLKNPTIKEHLDNLIDSNLVKKEESENKWKYYSLTRKGKKIIQPEEVNVLFAFSFSLLSALTLGAVWLREQLQQTTIEPTLARVASEPVSNEIAAYAILTNVTPELASQAIETTSTIAPTIALILSISIALLIGTGSYLLYKKRK